MVTALIGKLLIKVRDKPKGSIFCSNKLRKDDVIMCLKDNRYANGECSPCRNCSEFLNTCRPIIVGGYVFGECDICYCEFCDMYEECTSQERS